MEQVCRIIADIHEKRSGTLAALRRMNVEVVVRPLRVADYIVTPGVIVERKTVRDLHTSLRQGRLWSQVGRLRRAARFPYVFVEGHDLDAGPVPPSRIRGVCLAIIGQGVPVVFTSDVLDTATWLRLLARRHPEQRIARDRPRYAHPPNLRGQQVAEAMLAAVPTISVVRARALLAKFGSVSSVVAAGPEAWLETPGIGAAAARELTRAIS